MSKNRVFPVGLNLKVKKLIYPVPAASGNMVKTGMTSGIQAASDVTRLRILSGLTFSSQPKAIASMTAMLGSMADLTRRKWSPSRK